MSSAAKTRDIYQGLTDKFLYNDDLNSIYMLLALYDIEENISNVCPIYTCSRDIRYRIKNIIKDREDAEVISQNLSIIINEDINKLELCFYLEGYKNGFNSPKYINLLEDKSLNLMNIEDIYERQYLFHFNIKNESIREFKYNCFRNIEKEKSTYLDELISTFANKVIKKKISNLGNYVERQLKINFDMYNFSIGEVDYSLSEKEVYKLYKLILRVLKKHLKKTYKEAFWIAINDRVLMRYS
ncbi:hypothetical protein Curi_c10530 [Gottschalkia acidurici 9a]|uniref:Uncharacterized protein n=1 Tax=Gottschalkia acidurici (strain ATCC 7906 / DSM 604 / BCRC 14475 / CIP 104303 / KCTC 5404 / NCIMB 10678 / 9a) TaxID=1128398 RepID=K0AZ45_GOTA9|nr:hypothetical protein [Gottschalkia acidurici]AFS78067.1 hypothetical protein Curi_c10530 [Gottschalkia acidurici 9a]